MNLSYFDIIPRDISGYLLNFINPKSFRAISLIKIFQSLYQETKRLEQYVKYKGGWLSDANDGLCWASSKGSYVLINFFIEKGATDFNRGLFVIAKKGHRDLIDFFR